MTDFVTSISTIGALRTWWDSTVPASIPTGDRYIADLAAGAYNFASVSTTWGGKTVPAGAEIIIRAATAARLTTPTRPLRGGADGVRFATGNQSVVFTSFRVRLQGVQFIMSAAPSAVVRLTAYSTFEHCIFDGVAPGFDDVQNSLLDSLVVGDQVVGVGQPQTTIHHSTIVNFGVGVAAQVNQNLAGSNNAFIALGGGNSIGGSGSITGSKNAFNVGGTAGTSPITVTASAEFENVASAATADLRLKSTSTLKTAGAAAIGSGIDVYWLTRNASTPSVGAWEYSVAAPTGPTITTQPTAATVTAPNTASFSAAATVSSGGGTMTRQWQRYDGSTWASVPDGTGATTDNYTTTATAVSSGNWRNGYQVRGAYSDSNGTTYTDAVTLTVNAPAVTATLNFQAAGMEFGRRTGLSISTFALDATANYRFTVHADALVLGAAVYSSGVVATDSAGKLPNLSSGSLVTGTTYRVVAIRQADGEACTFRMVAA